MPTAIVISQMFAYEIMSIVSTNPCSFLGLEVPVCWPLSHQIRNDCVSMVDRLLPRVGHDSLTARSHASFVPHQALDATRSFGPRGAIASGR
jgi:hypothetical protein